MSKTVSIRWNGEKEDPDEITQYGVVFPKGKWVDVPVDHAMMHKFKANKYFEVKGEPALVVPVISAPKPDPAKAEGQTGATGATGAVTS